MEKHEIITAYILDKMSDIKQLANKLTGLKGKLKLYIKEPVSDSEFTLIRRYIAKHYSLTGDGYTISEGVSVKLVNE